MSNRFNISLLIYLVVQGVLFGIGTVIILATELAEQANWLMPLNVVITFIIAVPLAWIIAPRMMLRRRRRFYRSSYTLAHKSH